MMLIIQIALGIVLACLILAFFPYILGAGIFLLVAVVVLVGLTSVLGPDSLESLAVITFFAWIAISVYRGFRDPNRTRSLIPNAYWIAFWVGNALVLALGLVVGRGFPQSTVGGFRLADLGAMLFSVVLLGSMAAVAIAEHVLAKRAQDSTD